MIHKSIMLSKAVLFGSTLLNQDNFLYLQFAGPIKAHGFALPVWWSTVEGKLVSVALLAT